MRPSSKIHWENAARLIEPQVNASGIHEWPFHASFPMDVRFLRLSAPSTIALRRHDYYEILYLESGEAVYRVQDRLIRVRQGDLFVMGSPFFHGIQQYVSPSVNVVVLYFLPSLIWSEDISGESAEFLMPFQLQGTDFPHVVPASTGVPAQVLDLMRRAHRDLAHDTPRAHLSMKIYLRMILVLLMNYYASYRPTVDAVIRKERDLERLRPLFDYLDRHYGEAVTIDDAADRLRMSKSHFMRFFRAVTGQSFIAHLNRFRVAKAQHLMATTDRTIAAISQEVGFCDQSYFGLVFRRLAGMTPREYREKLRSRDRGLEAG